MTLKIILTLICASNLIETNASFELSKENLIRTYLNVSKEQEEHFIAEYGLKPDTNLTDQLKVVDVRSRNSDEEEDYYLNGEPVDVFTENATYMHNGVYYDDLPQFRFTQTNGYEKGTRVTVAYDVDGEIRQISKVGKNRIEELVPIVPGSPYMVSIKEYDAEELQRNVGLEEHDDDDDEHDEHRATGSDPQPELQLLRSQTNAVASVVDECEFYLRIELAVVYDSTFCAKHANSRETADNEVMILVAESSARYQQEGLCTKIEISHLEGWCDDTIDPYKGMVAEEKSGCNSDDNVGLLHNFTNYWNANRGNVKRDATQLLSGKGMDCTSSGRCVAGCATVSSTCEIERAYSVIWATFRGADALKSALMAHELGHNNGAQHYNEEKDFIMNAVLQKAENDFSPASIREMRSHFSEVSCLDEVEINLDVRNITVDDDDIDEDPGFLCKIIDSFLSFLKKPKSTESPFVTFLKFSPLAIFLLAFATCAKYCGKAKEEDDSPPTDDESVVKPSRNMPQFAKNPMWRRSSV